MNFQNLNNAFDFRVGSETRNLPVFNVPGWSAVAIFVIFGELGEGKARGIKRGFTAVFYLAQHFFYQLAGVGSGQSPTPDASPLAVFIGEGDAGVKIPVVVPDRACTRSTHTSTNYEHNRGGRHATPSRRMQQLQHSGSTGSDCFISRSATGRGNVRQRVAEGWQRLLTSGSQVRVLLGSLPFPPTCTNYCPNQSELSPERRSESQAGIRVSGSADAL